MSKGVPEVRQEDDGVPIGGNYFGGIREEWGHVDGSQPGGHHRSLHLPGWFVYIHEPGVDCGGPGEGNFVTFTNL